MKFAAGFLFALLAVVPQPKTTIEYQVVIREPAKQEPADTPVIDSLMTDEDWARIERESDCLFDYLQMHFGWDITLDRVMAGGYWTDELGGACAVMETIDLGD